MKHFDLESRNCSKILKRGRPYTLCLGAGVCYGIMPNWKELAFLMLKEIVNPKLTDSEFEKIVSDLGWSLDSIIQAALNYSVDNGGDIEGFNNKMQTLLYQDLIRKASMYGIEKELKTFISDPFKRHSSHIPKLFDFFYAEYNTTSLYQICDFLIKANDGGNSPKAVLTFNADVLLHSLLTLMQLKKTYDETGVANTADFTYKAVHHIIESDGHKVPIYHIHGSIVPNTGRRDARVNLVFPETTYHSVSGSTHSWQQTIFNYYALRSRMLFVGMSMSDSNVRRWLSHTNSVLNKDIEDLSEKKANAARHIWLTTKCSSDTERQIKKLGLWHLGVKVGEITDWSRVSTALLNLAL